MIHRDLLEDVYAFLPWLHSTEVCEHLFGTMRSIVKDFTMLDFVYMMPKLLIRICEYILNTTSPTGKARASGYNHTHADCDGVDLPLLSIFPSDDEINQFTIQAFGEAQNLLAITGIIPTGLRSVLPNIDSWFSGSGDRDTPGSEAEILEKNYKTGGDELEEDVSKIFDCAKGKACGNLSHSSSEIEGLGYAAIMSSVGDSMHM